VLIGVTEARAKVSSIQLTPELLNDPAAMQKFQAAQGQLTQALKSLFAVTEAYPQLKSDANFRESAGADRGHGESHHRGAQSLYRRGAQLQRHRALLPGQSHRQAVWFSVKPNFTVENESAIAVAPKVDFGTGVAAQAREGSQPPPAAAPATPH